MLELVDVSKSFGGVSAVSGLSLAFEPEQVNALIGPNGAGKTTVFNLISGFLTPDAGRIVHRGRRIDGLPPWRVARRGVGRLFQDVRVFDRLTVRENVMVAFQHQKGENALRALVSRRRVAREERAFGERAAGLIEFAGLTELADVGADKLSFGQQKLLAIARLMAADADMLLLDEPTAGVNPRIVEKLLGILRRLAEDGKTVVLIEHNMNFVAETADRVCFMDEGRLVSSGDVASVFADAEIRASYLGIRAV